MTRETKVKTQPEELILETEVSQGICITAGRLELVSHYRKQRSCTFIRLFMSLYFPLAIDWNENN